MPRRPSFLHRLPLGLAYLFPTFLLLFTVELTARAIWVKGSALDNLVSYGSDRLYWFLSTDRYAPVRRRKPAAWTAREPGTVRIMTLGESTTAGTPWPPTIAYPYMLQKMLSARFPGKRIEVYNVGFFAQTYRFSAELVRDAQRLGVTHFVFYSGHNEMYPFNLYWTVRRQKPWYRPFDSLRGWLVNHSVAFAALSSFRAPTDSRYSKSLNNFDALSHVPAAVKNFDTLTNQIIRDGSRIGSTMMWVVPLRNIKDFPPVPGDETKPLLSPAQAAKLVRANGLIPSECFSLGRYFLSRKQAGRARQYFAAASDATLRVGRVHSSLIAHVIARLPKQYPGVLVVDPEPQLTQKQQVDLLGDETFTDWCHLTLEAHFEVARVIADNLMPSLTSSLGPAEFPPLSLKEIVANQVKEQVVGFEQAGLFNMQSERWPQARSYFLKRLEHGFSARSVNGLAYIAAQTGDLEEARKHMERLIHQGSPDDIQKALKKLAPYDQGIFLDTLKRLKIRLLANPSGKL